MVSRAPIEAMKDKVVVITGASSALYGMQVALEHFQQRGRGHIVNVSSVHAGVVATDFGLSALHGGVEPTASRTRCLSLEWC